MAKSNGTDDRANGAMSDGSSSWKSALLGALPFMLWGITLITLELPHEWATPGWIQAGLAVLFSAILLVLPIGLGVARTQGFPRWSYPYLTMAALCSLFLMNATTPGMRLFGYPTFGREVWGWRAWIPLLMVAAVALLISRSLGPVSMLFKNVRNDWTLLTFSLFGLMPLLIMIFFYEIDRLFSLFFMVAFTLVAVATALIYLRSGQSGKRSLALVVGIVSTMAIIVIGPNVYWQSHGGMNHIPSIVAGMVLALVMILPSLINHQRNSDRALTRSGT